VSEILVEYNRSIKIVMSISLKKISLKRRAIVKRTTALLLIAIVAVTSWSSCAKNKIVDITTIFSSSYPIVATPFLMPALTAPDTNDSLLFPQPKTENKHNRFYEFSIVFNENLQQILSYFSRLNEDKSKVVYNYLPSYSNNPLAVNACKENT